MKSNALLLFFYIVMLCFGGSLSLDPSEAAHHKNNLRVEGPQFRIVSLDDDPINTISDESGTLLSLTPTPSPTTQVEGISLAQDGPTKTARAPPEQDLTLIWMAITVWILCFCAYAVAGEEQHSAAERARALGRMERFNLSSTSTTTPTARRENVDRTQEPEVPYSDVCNSISEIGDVELESCSICLDQFQLSTPVKKLRCGHIYHPDCIDIWLEVSPRCPLCRHDSRRANVHNGPLDEAANIELTVIGHVTTMNFTAMLHPDVRFGVTIASTSNGLLVTYVEPDGAGAEQRVEVGDFLVKQDGESIPRDIGDAEFVAQLIALARPVELGFVRQIDSNIDSPNSTLESELESEPESAAAEVVPEISPMISPAEVLAPVPPVIEE